MFSRLNSLAIYALLLAGVLYSGTTKADEILGDVRGWKIIYSDEYKGCIARGSYQDGTIVIFGYDGISNSQFVSFGNPNWSRFPVNQNYKINFDVIGRSIFSGYFHSVYRRGITTFENGSVTDYFVEALAAASTMKVYIEADYITTLSLRGTRAAFQAAIECQSYRMGG